MTIIIFLIILSLLVAIHEWGHMWVAKVNKIRVDTFAIGFKPTLFKKKFGETMYKFNLIPLGGYVSIFGESLDDAQEMTPEHPEYDRSFISKKWWQQVLVLLGGIFMNLILAWALFSWALMLGAPTLVEEQGKGVDTKVLEVIDGSTAQEIGLELNDSVIKISRKIPTKNDKVWITKNIENPTPDLISEIVQEIDPAPSDEEKPNKGQLIWVSVERDGEEIIFDEIQLKNTIYSETLEKEIYQFGIQTGLVSIVKESFGKSIIDGAKQTYRSSAQTLDGLFKLATGKLGVDNLSGPVGIAGVVGDARKLGFVYLLTISAQISVALAVFNLLPIPALDGGRVLFVIIEAIRGKRFKPEVAAVVNTIGFFLLIGLMIFVTVKDILKIV